MKKLPVALASTPACRRDGGATSGLPRDAMGGSFSLDEFQSYIPFFQDEYRSFTDRLGAFRAKADVVSRHAKLCYDASSSL